jgi:hypothetical protein
MTIATFVTYEGIRKQLRVLHDSKDLSWPKIAARDEYAPIPAGTLYDIYCGKLIPKKWHEQLRYPKPRPPRISIRLDNPESAARSIQKHMEAGVVAEMIGLLNG